MTVSSYR